MSDSETNSVDAARRIDARCDAFERALVAGESPVIENYLADHSSPQREELLCELLGIDIDFRFAHGEQPAISDYIARFPELLVEQISAIFNASQPSPNLPCADPSTEHPTLISPSAEVSANVTTSAPVAVRYFGDYELLREIARGGMGVVYEARQRSLNRPVALKMILAGQLARPEEVTRFRREAEAAAQLEHPGIVPIFEIGQHGDQHYFTMGYVAGPSLSTRLLDRPLDPREAACLMHEVSLAVQYAHDRGVVHRDLKPSNILLAPRLDRQAGDFLYAPRVTDFGLAKLSRSDQNLTETGQILGTPSYMPPEQAAGQIHDVGPSADVYSLGAVLYTCLTGRPPFQAASALDTVRQVMERDPVALRELNAAVPQDLETICLKCLEKSIPRRYATAQAVADELQRYLEGRPIQARPVSQSERAWRWCKRSPVVAGLSVAVVLTLLVGIIASSYFAWKESLARIDADENAGAAKLAAKTAKEAEKERTEQLWRSLIEQAKAGRVSGRIGQRFNGLAALKRAAEIRPTLEIRNEVIACLALVDVRPAPHGTPPVQPGGTYCGGASYSRKSSDPTTGRWCPLDRQRNVTVIGANNRRELSLEHPDEVVSAVWRPDGKQLAIACEDLAIYTWRVPGGELQSALNGQAAAYSLSFSPSGRFLSSREIGGVLRIWDPVIGRQLLWSDIPNTPLRFGTTDEQMAAPPDNSPWELATGDACRVLHHSVTGARGGTGALHRNHSARFDPKGNRVVTVGGEMVFWDPDTGNELGRLPEATGAMAEFLPDGDLVAIEGDNVHRRSAVAPYDRVGQSLHTISSRALGWSRRVCGVSPDGEWVAVAENSVGSDSCITLVSTSGQQKRVSCPQRAAYDADFSCDGRWLATSGNVENTGDPVRIWEVPTGRLVQELPNTVYSRVLFSSDGHWLVTGSAECYQFWDVKTWEPQLRIPRWGRNTGQMAFTRDGRTLACVTEPLTVKLLDASTGNELATLTPPTPSTIEDLSFSPDGTKLVVATGTAVAYLWNLTEIRRQLQEMGLDWESGEGPGSVKNDSKKPREKPEPDTQAPIEPSKPDPKSTEPTRAPEQPDLTYQVERPPSRSGNLDSAAAVRLNDAVLSEMRIQHAVGVGVGVITNGELVFLNAYGLADRERQRPMTVDSRINWAYGSQFLMAVLAMQLIQEGKLQLEDPVDKFGLDLLPEHSAITVRHLLCHQSGLPGYSRGQALGTALNSNTSLQPVDPVTSVDRFNRSQLLFQPGRAELVGDYGYILLSAIVQRAAGTDLSDQLQKRIIQPLQLTSLELDGTTPQDSPTWAAGYQRTSDAVVRTPEYAHGWKFGASGYKSSIRDYARFMQAFLNDELLTAESRAVMSTPQKLSTGVATTMAFSARVSQSEDRDVLSATGSQSEATSQYMLIPAVRAGVVVLTNCRHVSPTRITDAVQRALKTAARFNE